MATKTDGINRSLEKLLSEVDYAFMNTQYKPSANAIEFINFIKMVNGVEGEENKSPVIHLDMLDNAIANDNNLFVAARGTAKTTALHEYAFLYMGTYGEFFDFGNVEVAMYVSDTIDNGVKSMRKNLQFRYENSEFLQKYIPEANFTDVRWEFINLAGHKFCVRGFGANTGVRGFKEYGKRPTWCGFDDLMSDKNAESPTIVKDITNIIYKAARQAMHPKKRKVVWTGTPFNKKDPLYKAAGSKAWNTRVYPICEKFPCTREDFRGAWEDRFSYDFIKAEYESLKDAGQIDAFNQELMLKISSDEDRIVLDSDIKWYKRAHLLPAISNFNVYITTDFATSGEAKADFSTIGVFAVNHIGQWFLVDGICRRQTMDKNIDDLFRLVQQYSPLSVGIEVSGQQGGFISLLGQSMMERNCFFNLASDNNGGKPGIRPTAQKFDRFHMNVVPWFKQGVIHLPEDMQDHPLVVEMVEELQSATVGGFKSAHDDALDLLSQLTVMNAWRPSANMTEGFTGSNSQWGSPLSYGSDSEDDASINSYVV